MDSFLVKASLLVPTVVLSFISEAEGKYCFVMDNGQTKYFPCGPFQHCCGMSCCENFGPFYRLWYFWLCVMLALVFCSFGGYWYRRHYFQHRLIGSTQRTAGGHNTMMMFMMNNIQTNNHYDVRGPEYFYPARCQRSSSHVRTHHSAPFASSSSSDELTPPGTRNQAPPPPPSLAMATPPPSYYETVYMPPPPDYSAYFNSQVGTCDPPTAHIEDSTPYRTGHPAETTH